jgi:hypothetical protein
VRIVAHEKSIQKKGVISEMEDNRVIYNATELVDGSYGLYSVNDPDARNRLGDVDLGSSNTTFISNFPRWSDLVGHFRDDSRFPVGWWKMFRGNVIRVQYLSGFWSDVPLQYI